MCTYIAVGDRSVLALAQCYVCNLYINVSQYEAIWLHRSGSCHLRPATTAYNGQNPNTGALSPSVYTGKRTVSRLCSLADLSTDKCKVRRITLACSLHVLIYTLYPGFHTRPLPQPQQIIINQSKSINLCAIAVTSYMLLLLETWLCPATARLPVDLSVGPIASLAARLLADLYVNPTASLVVSLQLSAQSLTGSAHVQVIMQTERMHEAQRLTDIVAASEDEHGTEWVSPWMHNV